MLKVPAAAYNLEWEVVIPPVVFVFVWLLWDCRYIYVPTCSLHKAKASAAEKHKFGFDFLHKCCSTCAFLYIPAVVCSPELVVFTQTLMLKHWCHADTCRAAAPAPQRVRATIT